MFASSCSSLLTSRLLYRGASGYFHGGESLYLSNIHLHVKFDWTIRWIGTWLVQAGAGVECSLFSFSILFVTHVVTYSRQGALNI